VQRRRAFAAPGVHAAELWIADIVPPLAVARCGGDWKDELRVDGVVRRFIESNATRKSTALLSSNFGCIKHLGKSPDREGAFGGRVEF
jgi:hypothetical protein